MELFEPVEGAFDEGGLLDEGGSVDPVSGNDVPTGSTQEEVRDDIPAQLSEGEFVLPADVVRYHGLEKIMELRDEAKAGLQKMEDMGQMGNSEEATLPDDVPFSMDDLEMEDDGVAEYQVGGYVPPPNVSFQQSQFAGYQPQIAQPVTQPSTVPTYQAPTQQFTPTQTAAAPSFAAFTQPTSVTYYHADGRTIQVPVDASGNPLIPVPAGFSATKPAAAAPTTPTTTTPTYQPPAQQQDDSGPSPEQLQQQEEYKQTVNKRMEAAEKLGYTKKQNALEAVLPFVVPGASLLTGKPERGTVLVDGTIADGTGGSFDPISGEKVGGAGGILSNIATSLGLGKKEEISEAASQMGVSPASIEGLKTIKGEESIQALLDEAGKTTIPSATVETARVTEEGAAGEVAQKAAEKITETPEQLDARVDKVLDYMNTITKGDVKVVSREQGGNIVVEGPDALGTENITSVITPQGDVIRQYDGSDEIRDPYKREDLAMPTRRDTAQVAGQTQRDKEIAAEQARQLDQEASAVAEATRRSNIRNAKAIREQKQEDSSYNPYTDKQTAYTSTSGRSFNVSGIATDDKPGRGTTFASGHLTTDSSGKVTGAAIPGSKEHEDRSGGNNDEPSGDCCFIMLEARYGDGTMDDVVRRYRDEYMTERNKRGYYKLAEVFIPLMRKYPAFKWLVTKTFADPLVSYGKYYYGQNKHGVIYYPIKAFWMKVFDVLGTDTEFVRENGEVV